MLYYVQVHLLGVKPGIRYLGFTTISLILGLKRGSLTASFHLAFVDLIINSNRRFDHFKQILRFIHSADLVFNEILETIIELGGEGITFLI
jgi:hypothetical protein